MGNQDPQDKGHAGECETRRYTRPDVANVVAPRTSTRRVREDQVLSLTHALYTKGKRAHELSLRAWLSPLSHPAEPITYMTVGYPERISRVIQSHQVRSPDAQPDFTCLFFNTKLTRILVP